MLMWAVFLFMASVFAPLLGLSGPSHFFFIFLVIFLIALVVGRNETARNADAAATFYPQGRWRRQGKSRKA